jgi:hypothetical protein
MEEKTTAQIFEIARLTNKWNMTRWLRPWAKEWCAKLLDPDADAEKIDSEMMAKMLVISWELGDEVRFFKTMEELSKQCYVKHVDDGNYEDDMGRRYVLANTEGQSIEDMLALLPLPADLTHRILKLRCRSMAALDDVCKNTLAALAMRRDTMLLGVVHESIFETLGSYPTLHSAPGEPVYKLVRAYNWAFLAAWKRSNRAVERQLLWTVIRNINRIRGNRYERLAAPDYLERLADQRRVSGLQTTGELQKKLAQLEVESPGYHAGSNVQPRGGDQ